LVGITLQKRQNLCHLSTYYLLDTAEINGITSSQSIDDSDAMETQEDKNYIAETTSLPKTKLYTTFTKLYFLTFIEYVNMMKTVVEDIEI